MGFGVGLPAVAATEPAQPVPVLPEAGATEAAIRAIHLQFRLGHLFHAFIIHESLAVCQVDNEWGFCGRVFFGSGQPELKHGKQRLGYAVPRAFFVGLRWPSVPLHLPSSLDHASNLSGEAGECGSEITYSL